MDLLKLKLSQAPKNNSLNTIFRVRVYNNLVTFFTTFINKNNLNFKFRSYGNITTTGMLNEYNVLVT